MDTVTVRPYTERVREAERVIRQLREASDAAYAALYAGNTDLLRSVADLAAVNAHYLGELAGAIKGER